jgi:uncharacterized protein YhjY with autotransporter beta-barrel domain
LNIVPITGHQRVPLDSATALRALADKIESGECTGVVWAATVAGEYEMRSGSSLTDGLVLAALLHDWSVRRFRE